MIVGSALGTMLVLAAITAAALDIRWCSGQAFALNWLGILLLLPFLAVPLVGIWGLLLAGRDRRQLQDQAPAGPKAHVRLQCRDAGRSPFKRAPHRMPRLVLYNEAPMTAIDRRTVVILSLLAVALLVVVLVAAGLAPLLFGLFTLVPYAVIPIMGLWVTFGVIRGRPEKPMYRIPDPDGVQYWE